MASYDVFLNQLNSEIWEVTRGNQFNITTETRRLTQVEWSSVQRIMREHDIAVEPFNACMGFGCGIRLLEPPLYPGMTPRLLSAVTQVHLPPTEGRDRVGFDEGWERFREFFDTERNRELLTFCGIRHPRPKSYYEY